MDYTKLIRISQDPLKIFDKFEGFFLLTIDSVKPGFYDDAIDAWVQPWPIKSIIQINFTLFNYSLHNSTGGVSGYIDNIKLVTSLNSGTEIIDIKPGESRSGQFWMYAAESGQHKLVLEYLIADGQTFTPYNPSIGPVDSPFKPVFKTLASCEQNYLALGNQLILSTPYQNPNGQFGVCENKTFPRSAPLEWKPITEETVGVSGVAIILDKISKGISTHDFMFSHPFGLLDFEFSVVPDNDTNFTKLLALNNTHGTSNPDIKYGIELAQDLLDPYHRNPQLFQGLLGVEIDQGLIPTSKDPEIRFRPIDGDRVAVFGTWIEDCGHDDFHSEIHPPLLIASAHSLLNSDGTQNYDKTHSTLISKAYSVNQLYYSVGGNYDPFKTHMLNEIQTQFWWPFHTLEASVAFDSKPFKYDQNIVYKVAPEAPRYSSKDRLIVKYHFTVRTGVTVSLNISDEGSVTVEITMSVKDYVAPDLPGSITVRFDKEYITQMDQGGGDTYDLVEKLEDYLNPIARAFTEQGIFMKVYDKLTIDTSNAVYDNKIVTDDAQPFPVYGWLVVEWERERKINDNILSHLLTYRQALESAGVKVEEEKSKTYYSRFNSIRLYKGQNTSSEIINPQTNQILRSNSITQIYFRIKRLIIKHGMVEQVEAQIYQLFIKKIMDGPGIFFYRLAEDSDIYNFALMFNSRETYWSNANTIENLYKVLHEKIIKFLIIEHEWMEGVLWQR